MTDISYFWARIKYDKTIFRFKFGINNFRQYFTQTCVIKTTGKMVFDNSFWNFPDCKLTIVHGEPLLQTSFNRISRLINILRHSGNRVLWRVYARLSFKRICRWFLMSTKRYLSVWALWARACYCTVKQ